MISTVQYIVNIICARPALNRLFSTTYNYFDLQRPQQVIYKIYPQTCRSNSCLAYPFQSSDGQIQCPRSNFFKLKNSYNIIILYLTGKIFAQSITKIFEGFFLFPPPPAPNSFTRLQPAFSFLKISSLHSRISKANLDQLFEISKFTPSVCTKDPEFDKLVTVNPKNYQANLDQLLAINTQINKRKLKTSYMYLRSLIDEENSAS